MKPTILFIAVSFLLVGPLGASARGGDPSQEAVERFEAGEFDAAREHFESTLQRDENDHQSNYYLGRIALQEEKLDEAITRLKLAVDLEQANSTYRTWLGRAYIAKLQGADYFEKGTLAGRALEQLERAVKLDPANMEARLTLAGYYSSAPSIAGGSKKKAHEQLEVVKDYDPVRANAMFASLHIKDEEFELAIEKLEACVKAEPENTDHRYSLAMVHQKLEQYDQAFAAFEQAVEIDPEAIGALYQIGRTAVFSGTNLDRGIDCLEDYMKRPVLPGYPGHDAVHWRLGMLFEHKGDLERARREYEAAIELDPDQASYRESLEALEAL